MTALPSTTLDAIKTATGAALSQRRLDKLTSEALYAPLGGSVHVAPSDMMVLIQMAERATSAEAELARLREENERLRKALEPHRD